MSLSRKELNFNEAPSNFREALQTFGLNWEVGLRPIWTADKDGKLKEISKYRSVVRLDNDTPLSVVGRTYRPMQQWECSDVIDEVVSNVGGKFVNGGMFNGGERTFVQALLPDSITVRGSKDDQIKKYIVCLSSHDSSLPTVMGGSSTRIICENTFLMCLKEARRDVRIRHTSNAEVRLVEAKDILKAMLDYHAKVELRVNELAAVRFTDQMMNETLRKVFEVDTKLPFSELPTRTKNSMSTVMEHFQYGKGIDVSNRGSGWAALNSFSEFSNWDKVVKNEKGDPMARTESLLLGSGMQFNLRAQAAIESVAGLA